MMRIILISYAVGFVLVTVLMPFLIRYLKKRNASQTEREIMESHVKKQGTPTMGGIRILTPIFLVGLWKMGADPKVLSVMILTFGFGAVGFLDDFLKVFLRRSDGLLAWQKFGLQFLVTGVFAWHLTQIAHVSLAMKIPFWEGHFLDLGWFNYAILYFVVLGTVNGVNFTDGLDGLVSSVTIMASIFFLSVAMASGSDAACIPAAIIGALSAFLIYNHYPAQIFMGDTGSLALGGYVAGIAYAFQVPLFIVLAGFIYLIEVISVILQVGSFKLRHGKRIFRMAPIHHHFELGGWSEVKVVLVFVAVTAVGTLLALLGYRVWI